jgi:hypothetical protein
VLIETDAVPNSAGVIGLADRFPPTTGTTVVVVEHALDKAFAQMPAIQAWCFVRALHTHSQYIFPGTERFGYIECEWFEIARMMPKVLTVQVHIGEIIHAVEMEAGKLPARTVTEFMAKPNDAVVVKPTQEPVCRDGHRFPGRIVIYSFAELKIIFSNIAPEAVQINTDGDLLISNIPIFLIIP